MTKTNDDSRRAIGRGIDWLVAQQAADGGWHSATYGQLKDGAAVTALVLDALGHQPATDQQRHLVAIKKGFAFLDRGLAKRATVASPDGSLDFPTYAAALYLTGKRRLSLTTEGQTRRALVDYLVGAQVGESRGFAADSPSRGGWDFLGPGDAQGITTGTNISVTRYVLEALTQQPGVAGRESGVGKAMEFGSEYVLRCQQPDGGFVFTSEPASLSNKAAYADEALKEPRSYGTATCDGVLALLACGLKGNDERVAKAIEWLVKRPSLELVPGFEGLPPEAGWQRGLRYYYYAGLARVLPHFPAGEIAPRREVLAAQLVKLQTKDGSWVNESDRMRENDPLIATALAIAALASCG
jgi:prenyltransferase beta subunit